MEPHRPESPFVSFTDLFTGVLLIFVFLIVVLALNQRISTEENVTEASRSGNQTIDQQDGAPDGGVVVPKGQRSEVQQAFMDALFDRITKAGVRLEFDPHNDAFVLAENILFRKNDATISIDQRHTIRTLGLQLLEALSCSAPRLCDEAVKSLSAVLIEGHTDTTGDDSVNWRLSAERAYATFEALVQEVPALGSLTVFRPDPAAPTKALVGIAAYGKTRLRVPTADEVDEPSNRRIEIRFVFAGGN